MSARAPAISARRELRGLDVRALSVGHHVLWGRAQLAADLEVELPLVVVSGGRPGPVLAVTAGIHGDEFEGQAAIPRVAERLDPRALRGIFLGLPVCNPLAAAAGTRTTPVDGANLARVFPGDGGSPTRTLARELFAFLTASLTSDDLLVDLHSGGATNRFLPMVGYRDVAVPARRPSEEAARRFGGGMLWQIPDQRGTLTAELVRCGTACIGTEAPGEGRCSPVDVERNMQGLERLLCWKGMVPAGGDLPRLDGPAYESVELTAPASGLLEATVRLGCAVAAGVVVARVWSPVGETLAEIRAPEAGRIGALRTFGSVPKGEIVAWLCRPAGPTSVFDPPTTR